MIKFHTIGQIEKQYVMEDAVVDTEVFNGAFGSVSSGKFTPAANATKAIMKIEVGDNAGLDKYPIAAGSHVRIVDFAKINGQYIDIIGYPLPDAFAVNDKLVSKADGSLETGGSAAPYYEVTEIIGNNEGVVAKVVAE